MASGGDKSREKMQGCGVGMMKMGCGMMLLAVFVPLLVIFLIGVL